VSQIIPRNERTISREARVNTRPSARRAAAAAHPPSIGERTIATSVSITP
jgi:hypothetical protein